MKNNINVINLVGRVGNKPEYLRFESGTELTKMSIAVKRNSKDSHPDWFSIELWGKLAEIAHKYATKGKLVGITGELKLEEWQDRDNNLRYKLVVRADKLDLLSSQSSNQSPNQSAVKERITVEW